MFKISTSPGMTLLFYTNVRNVMQKINNNLLIDL